MPRRTNQPQSFNDRMISYMVKESCRRTIGLAPMIVLVNGRHFQRFIGGRRPFEPWFGDFMIEIATHLMRRTGSRIAFTFFDEIALVFQSEDQRRFQHNASSIAAEASVYLNRFGPDRAPSLPWETMPTFSGSAWMVPTRPEAAHALQWRQGEAIKRSIQSFAHGVLPHDQVMNTSMEQLRENLRENKTPWESLTPHEKRGIFIQRRAPEIHLDALSPEERDALKVDLTAQADGTSALLESQFVVLDVVLNAVSNPLDVVFEGAEPVFPSVAA